MGGATAGDDRAALAELVAGYAWAVAQGHGARVAALFCEDGVFDKAPDRIVGRPALAEFYARTASEKGRVVPLVGNMIFEVTGDGATGVATLVGFGDNGGRRFAGYYEDSFRRVDGRWRFAARVFAMYFDRRAAPAEA